MFCLGSQYPSADSGFSDAKKTIAVRLQLDSILQHDNRHRLLYGSRSGSPTPGGDHLKGLALFSQDMRPQADDTSTKLIIETRSRYPDQHEHGIG